MRRFVPALEHQWKRSNGLSSLAPPSLLTPHLPLLPSRPHSLPNILDSFIILRFRIPEMQRLAPHYALTPRGVWAAKTFRRFDKSKDSNVRGGRAGWRGGGGRWSEGGDGTEIFACEDCGEVGGGGQNVREIKIRFCN